MNIMSMKPVILRDVLRDKDTYGESFTYTTVCGTERTATYREIQDAVRTWATQCVSFTKYNVYVPTAGNQRSKMHITFVEFITEHGGCTNKKFYAIDTQLLMDGMYIDSDLGKLSISDCCERRTISYNDLMKAVATMCYDWYDRKLPKDFKEHELRFFSSKDLGISLSKSFTECIDLFTVRTFAIVSPALMYYNDLNPVLKLIYNFDKPYYRDMYPYPFCSPEADWNIMAYYDNILRAYCDKHFIPVLYPK